MISTTSGQRSAHTQIRNHELAIESEPLVCELKIAADKQQQLVDLISSWDSHVDGAAAAEEAFFAGMSDKVRQAVSRLRDTLQQGDSEDTDEDEWTDSDDTEDTDDDDDEAELTALQAIEEIDTENEINEWLDNRPLTDSAHSVVISVEVAGDDDFVVVTVKARDDAEEDWDATLAAVQFIADGLKLEQAIQFTWSHHDPSHGGDCRHFAIVQAGCKPVVDIEAVNVPGKLPDTDVLPEFTTGWALIEVSPGKEQLAGEFAYNWRRSRREKKAEIARREAAGETPDTSHALLSLRRSVNGVDVIPFDAHGTIPDLTPGIAIHSLLIGKSMVFAMDVVGDCLLMLVKALRIEEPVRCDYVDVVSDQYEDLPWQINHSAGALIVQASEGVRNVILYDAVTAVIDAKRPKVTIYHGQVEPTVNVENPELVDVEIVDIADRDMLIVSHNGYLIYQAIKDASSNGEYFPSDWHVAPAPWRDIDDEEVFDLRDLPKLTDTQTRDYAAEYPNDSPDAISLRYAIDTDQLPIDISEYRDAAYED